MYTAAENMPKAATPRMISPCGPIIEPSKPERPAPEEDAAFIASASPFIALAAFGTVFAAAVAFLIDEDKAVIPDETQMCIRDRYPVFPIVPSAVPAYPLVLSMRPDINALGGVLFFVIQRDICLADHSAHPPIQKYVRDKSIS